MGQITEQQKFQLWEANAFKLYYKLRDLELYVECLSNSSNAVLEEIDSESIDGFNSEAVQELLVRLQGKIENSEETFNQLKEVVLSKIN